MAKKDGKIEERGVLILFFWKISNSQALQNACKNWVFQNVSFMGMKIRKPANFYIKISILYAWTTVGGQVQTGRAKGWNMQLPRKTGTLGHNSRDKRLLQLGRIDRKTPIERDLTTPCEDTWIVRRVLKTFKDPSFLYPHYPFPFYLIFIHNTAFT